MLFSILNCSFYLLTVWGACCIVLWIYSFCNHQDICRILHNAWFFTLQVHLLNHLFQDYRFDSIRPCCFCFLNKIFCWMICCSFFVSYITENFFHNETNWYFSSFFIAIASLVHQCLAISFCWRCSFCSILSDIQHHLFDVAFVNCSQ